MAHTVDDMQQWSNHSKPARHVGETILPGRTLPALAARLDERGYRAARVEDRG